jgi:hypothetical protein
VQVARGAAEHKLDRAIIDPTRAAQQRRAQGHRLQADHHALHVASVAAEEVIHSGGNALEESSSQRDSGMSIRREHAACPLRVSNRCSDDNQRLTRQRIGKDVPDTSEVQESGHVLS